MIRASAPGKVHLIGEHAVVYGEPAILAAIGKRSWVEAEPQKGKLTVRDRNQAAGAEWMVDDCIDSAVQASGMWLAGMEKGDFSGLFRFVKDGQNFKRVAAGMVLHRLKIEAGANVRIYGDIPLGSGLGSSSALAVALTKALSELNGIHLSPEELNKIAYDIEKMAHGTPSGGDNTTCTYGGLIWFERGQNPKPRIESLSGEIPSVMDNFVLAYIRKPARTTGELVSMVRELKPSFREPHVKAIGQASRQMRAALRDQDLPKVKELMNLAWDNLASMGLSIPEADRLISRIRGIGGAAKLCGACGGGIMLACHEDKKSLKKLIREAGYSPWETELGAPGVRLE